MPQSKQQKKENVARIAMERAGRTPKQQLALLDQKFGPGVGAEKERARLTKQIEEKK